MPADQQKYRKFRDAGFPHKAALYLADETDNVLDPASATPAPGTGPVLIAPDGGLWEVKVGNGGTPVYAVEYAAAEPDPGGGGTDPDPDPPHVNPPGPVVTGASYDPAYAQAHMPGVKIFALDMTPAEGVATTGWEDGDRWYFGRVRYREPDSATPLVETQAVTEPTMDAGSVLPGGHAWFDLGGAPADVNKVRVPSSYRIFYWPETGDEIAVTDWISIPQAEQDALRIAAWGAPVVGTAPGAPAAPVATAKDGGSAANLTWTAPADDGGQPISGYVLRSNAGHEMTVGAVLAAQMPGLTNATPYTFTVAAVNSIGEGPASPASNAVTPYSYEGPPIPVNIRATPGNATVLVEWDAGAPNGGSPLTGYKVENVTTGAQYSVVGPDIRQFQVTGLTNGTTYTFIVRPMNMYGGGTPSSTVTTTPFIPALFFHDTATSPDGPVTVMETYNESGGVNATKYAEAANGIHNTEANGAFLAKNVAQAAQKITARVKLSATAASTRVAVRGRQNMSFANSWVGVDLRHTGGQYVLTLRTSNGGNGGGYVGIVRSTANAPAGVAAGVEVDLVLTCVGKQLTASVQPVGGTKTEISHFMAQSDADYNEHTTGVGYQQFRGAAPTDADSRLLTYKVENP